MNDADSPQGEKRKCHMLVSLGNTHLDSAVFVLAYPGAIQYFLLVERKKQKPYLANRSRVEMKAAADRSGLSHDVTHSICT